MCVLKKLFKCREYRNTICSNEKPNPEGQINPPYSTCILATSSQEVLRTSESVFRQYKLFNQYSSTTPSIILP